MRDIEEGTGVKLNQGSGRPLFLAGEVRAGGVMRRLTMEIDSGADRSILSLSEVKRLNLKLREFNTQYISVYSYVFLPKSIQ